MRSRSEFAPDGPLGIAIVALAISKVTGMPVLRAIEARGRYYGVLPDSDTFDAAAEIVGLPYCRALDLYVDPGTKARAEALHFTQAHLALL